MRQAQRDARSARRRFPFIATIPISVGLLAMSLSVISLVPTPAIATAATKDLLRFTVSPTPVMAGSKVMLRSVDPCPIPPGTSNLSSAAAFSFGYVDRGTYNFIQGWDAAVTATGHWSSSSFRVPPLGHGLGRFTYGGSGVDFGKPVDIVPGTYYFTALCQSDTGLAYANYRTDTVTLTSPSAAARTPITPYQRGRALAEKINKSTPPIMCANVTQATLSEITANDHNEQFSLGLFNNLTQYGLGCVPAAFYMPNTYTHLPDAIALAAAYDTGSVKSSVTQFLYSAFVNTGVTAGYDLPLLPKIAENSVAVTNFFRGLREGQIENWSNADDSGGILGPFERLAIVEVGLSWQAYANYHAYDGALSGGQLAAIMCAATRDNAGLAAVTNQIGTWFIAHGGEPSLPKTTGAAPMAGLVAWVTELTNMNGHVASSTGADIQRNQDWLWAGWFAFDQAALAVASFGVGELVSAFIDWIPAGVVEAIGNAVTRVVSPFATSYRDGQAVWAAERGERGFLTVTTETVAEAKTVLHACDTVYELIDGVHNEAQLLVDHLNTSPGVKYEIQYYLQIMQNTYHEAVARLMEEGLIVNSQGQVVPLNNAAAVDHVMSNAPDFYVRATNVTSTGIPVTIVAETVFGAFTSTH